MLLTFECWQGIARVVLFTFTTRNTGERNIVISSVSRFFAHDAKDYANVENRDNVDQLRKDLSEIYISGLLLC